LLEDLDILTVNFTVNIANQNKLKTKIMEVSLFVLGLISIVFGIALIVMAMKEEFDSNGFLENLLIIIFGIGFIFLGIMGWIAMVKISNNEREASKYKMKIEIRKEVINDKEISRDTVYIFTPKESK
jgi:arginine exporter protein ArgO